MTTWVQEVRHAVRALLTRPGFTAIVVLTLALGIGANTAVFSVLHAVLLAPLPYKDAEQLVRVYEIRRDAPASATSNYLTAPAVRDLQATLTTASSFAALYNYQRNAADLTDGDRPERVTVLPVSEGYFDVVGQTPVIGRTFRRDEVGVVPVAVVSHRVFTSYLSGTADGLPGTLTIDGTRFTVVGVMPESYEDPLEGNIDIFVPISELYSNESWGNHYLTAVARLRRGATVSQLNAELAAEAARHREASGDEGRTYVAVPLRDDVVGSADTTLWLMMGAVALVFLIACVNGTSVTLARGAARQKELAIRVALGSGRGRLIRQLLTESALLGMLGGLVGLGLGAGVVRGLVRLAPAGLPGIGEATLEGPVFLFGLGASVAAVLVFGLLPALRASRTSVEAALRQGGRSGGEGGSDRSRLRSALVVAEVSLALVLLVGAGILVRSFERLAAVDLVVDPRNVAVFHVGTPGARYDAGARARFHQEYLARLSTLPGVEAAGAVSWLP
ncbi:MAG: ABC transporter permease, partial [Longimicrobiales bacterium]